MGKKMKTPPREVTTEIQHEFNNAIPINGRMRVLVLHNSAIEQNPEQLQVFFGLRHREGDKIDYFACKAEDAAALAIEFKSLAMMARPSFDQKENEGLFVGAKLKVSRALQLLTELELSVVTYGRTARIDLVPLQHDPSRCRVEMIDPLPIEVPFLIGDVAHNLRSALDLMICEIARTQGKSASDLQFPFASTEGRYIDTVRNGHVRKLGRDVQDKLIALRAYKGGNDDLRGLHDLDILDKHRLIIPVLGAFRAEYDVAKDLEKRLSGTGLTLGYFGDTLYDIMSDGAILETAIVENYSLHRERPFTAFFDSEAPFASREVIPTLDQLARMTFDVITDFEVVIKTSP